MKLAEEDYENNFVKLGNSYEGKHGKIEVKGAGRSVKKKIFTLLKNVIKLSTYATPWAN